MTEPRPDDLGLAHCRLCGELVPVEHLDAGVCWLCRNGDDDEREVMFPDDPD